MPLLRINATTGGLALHDGVGDVTGQLKKHAAQSGPVIMMVHGYKYQPGSANHCPHGKIFGPSPLDWPARLGFAGDHADEGLAVAFGWDARGPLRRVHRLAAELGRELAAIISILKKHAPDRPVHVVAHSLGSEVALNALPHLPAGTINRIILLTGASYAQNAREILGTPAGRTADVLNVTSRENDVFDAAFERMVPPENPGDVAIGQGIRAPNVTTVQLDCAATLDRLKNSGFGIAAPRRRICHWSAYTRPGVMGLYRAFLRSPATTSLTGVLGSLPQHLSPRWSRLIGFRRNRNDTAIARAMPAAGAITRGRRKSEPA